MILYSYRMFGCNIIRWTDDKDFKELLKEKYKNGATNRIKILEYE